MLNTTSIVSWAASLVFAFFAVLLFSKPDKKSRLAYGLLALVCAVWSLSQGLFYFLVAGGNAPHDLLLFLNRLHHFLAASIGPIFFAFTRMFPQDTPLPARTFRALIGSSAALAYVYLFTDLVIFDIFPAEPGGLQYGWRYGSLQYLFYAHLFLPFAAGVRVLRQKVRATADAIERQQIARLMQALAFSAIPTVVIAIIMTAFGNFTLARYAPAMLLIWVAFTAYGSYRYHQIAVKLIVAELALLVMIMVLFLNIFVPDISFGTSALIPRTGTLSFNVYSAVNWFASVCFAAFTLILFSGNNRLSTRTYSLVSAALTLWAAAMGLYYMTTDHDLLLALNRFNHFIGGAVGLLFFYFALLFPEEKRPAAWVPISLVALQLVLGVFYFFTDLVIKDTFIVLGKNIENGWEFGKLGFLFHLNFAPFFFAGIFKLWRKFSRWDDPQVKNRLKIILAATVFGSLIGVTVAVILPLFGLFRFSWLGPAFTLSWVVTTAYAIVQYRVLNLRILAGQIAVIIMAAILFINIFVPEIAREGTSFFAPASAYIERALVAPTIASLANWIAGILLAAFSVVLYFGSNRPSTRMLSAISGSLAAWAFGAGLYYMAADLPLLHALNKFDHWVGSLAGFFLFLFAWKYPDERPLPARILYPLVVLEATIAAIFLGTDLVIARTIMVPGNPLASSWVFGPAGFLFHANLTVFYGAGILLLFRKYRTAAAPEEKRRLLVIPAATLAGSTITMTTNVILPLLGIYTFGWLGAPFSLTWVSLISYTIIHYKIFNVRLIIPELAILAMLTLLFVNIFLPQQHLADSFPGLLHLPGLLPLNIYSAMNWISGALLAIFGYLIYTGSTSASARAQARNAWWFSFWAFSMALYYSLEAMPGHPFQLALLRHLHWIGLPMFTTFFYFTLVYPSDTARYPRVKWLLIALSALLVYPHFFTDWVVRNIHFGSGILARYPIYGDYTFSLFHLPFAVFIVGGHLILAKKILATPHGEPRNHLIYTLLASSLLFLPSSILVLVLPSQQNFDQVPFGPVSALAWMMFVAYATLRHKILKLKIAIPSSLFALLVGIVFLNIFAPNLSDLSDISMPSGGISLYSVVPWITAAVLASFGVTIFFGNKNKATRAYSLIVFNVTAWALGIGAYFYTDSPEAMDLIIRYNHFIGGLIGVSFLYYTLLIPDERVRNRYVMPAIFALQAVLAYLYFATPHVIKGIVLPAGDILGRDWIYGPLGFISDSAFAIFLAAAFTNLRRRLDYIVGPDKKRRLYIFWTSFAGAVPGIVLIFILSQLGYRSIYWIVPTATLGWIFFSFYAIVRYHFLSVRVVVGEALLLLLAAILFGNIFVTGHLTAGSVGKIVVFAAFTTVGIFFIRDIIKNEDQKEELARLSVKLSDLGANLQKKVEERTAELARNKAHIETVIENLTSGLVEYANDGSVIRMNKTAEKMLGIRRESIIGRKIEKDSSAIAAITYPTDPNAADITVAIGSPVEKELQVTAYPITKDAVRIGTIRVLRDVTRENLISRSKSEFISIAAHQLRSPLSVIKWTLSALEAGDFGPLSPELSTAVADGSRMNQRMINLVNDLLVVARIEGGKYENTRKEEDLGTITEEAMVRSNPLAEQKHIVRAIAKTGAKPPLARVDREKISIAIGNVIANAYQYTPDGGSVSVTVASRPKQVDIIVRDSGIGISPAQKERLFSKFYRSEGALRMNPNGSGLGMFIIRHIVESHGGKMTVASRPGKGTTVTLSIPRT